MTAKTGSKRADKLATGGIAHARQGDEGRMGRLRGGGVRAVLPTMQASARRRAPRAPSAAGSPRKPKRGKRSSGLGGRLAAAMRMTRLRASRAAEDFRSRH